VTTNLFYFFLWASWAVITSWAVIKCSCRSPKTCLDS